MSEVSPKKRSKEDDKILIASFGRPKMTKLDEELLSDIKKEKERAEKAQNDRYEALRIPLTLPTQEEMNIILASIRSEIVKDQHRIFSFILQDSKDGMYFNNASENWDMLWLKRSNQWLLDYKEFVSNNFDDGGDRTFASNYIKDQLCAYFQSIADAWNAQYAVIQLVPELSSSYCGYEISYKN